MAISKLIFNGVTQMDVTGNTNTANTILQGYTGTKNDGTEIIGVYQGGTTTLNIPIIYDNTAQTVPLKVDNTNAPTAVEVWNALNQDIPITYSISGLPSGTSENRYTVGVVYEDNELGELCILIIDGYDLATVKIAWYLYFTSNSNWTYEYGGSYLVPNGTKSITSSGMIDVTRYANASIAAGQITAVATKGTPSGSSITVTPTVTTTAGWVPGGNTQGFAITVLASEVDNLGIKTITTNGTGIDVVGYSSVDVDVQGGPYPSAEGVIF